MQYKYGNFLEIETCDNFIKEQQDYLKASIELQFSVETIQESVVMCMTQKEIDKIIKHVEEKQWQEQQHI